MANTQSAKGITHWVRIFFRWLHRKRVMIGVRLALPEARMIRGAERGLAAMAAMMNEIARGEWSFVQALVYMRAHEDETCPDKLGAVWRWHVGELQFAERATGPWHVVPEPKWAHPKIANLKWHTKKESKPC